MKIAFHSYQLGARGTEIALYKYAKYNRELLGHESLIISTSTRPTPSLSRFDEFEVILYPDVWLNDGKNNSLRASLEKIVDNKQIDAFYAIKGGDDDGFMPTNCRRWAHSIFRLDQPHGDVYAAQCKYISDKYGGSFPWVHAIVDAPDVEGCFREKLGIPKDALVFGRHGGADTFSLDFVKEVIKKTVLNRQDCYFLFLNTDKFIEHERVIHLPAIIDEKEKTKFVKTCDAMMHARLDGEIFSLSTAEFSLQNKPVITWTGLVSDGKNNFRHPEYDYGHIEILKENAIYYHGPQDLYQILTQIDKNFIYSRNWDVYGETFSPENVMKEFESVFINNG